MGQQAMFVRLSRCNLRCPGCDTPYTWDTTRFDLREQTSTMAVEDLVAALLVKPPRLVVVTGGEPLLQQPAVTALAAALSAAGRRVEVETNGTVAPDAHLLAVVDRFNVSPKLSTFAAAGDAPIRPVALDVLVRSGKAVFKFVVSGPEGLTEIGRLEETFGLTPIWVMPAGTTSDAVTDGLRSVAEQTLERGWNLTGRLHVLLWGDQRGR